MGQNTTKNSHDKERCNILLLGIGGCGKTTCFNHMSLITQKYEVTNHLESAICENSVSNVAKALKILKKKNHDIPEYEKFEALYTSFQSGQRVNNVIFPLCLTLSAQYELSTIVKKNLKDFNFNDEIPYFLDPDNMSRFFTRGYKANMQDILSARTKTTGINFFNIEHDKTLLTFFDVGGQRSERKKWKNCFQNTDVLVYVISLSDYDEVLYEDDTEIGMTEALSIFEKTINGEYFQETPVLVYFNKKDVLDRKMRQEDCLKLLFSEYDGRQDTTKAEQFIISKFMNVIKTDERRVQYMAGAAIDKNSIQDLQTSVLDIVMKLSKDGLLQKNNKNTKSARSSRKSMTHSHFELTHSFVSPRQSGSFQVTSTQNYTPTKNCSPDTQIFGKIVKEEK